ncbi:sulfite exporter TauE/SafE family protein [Nesterenkonia sp. E16_7]|uniref:sulfite exporter TauE/SafE family protein n=1 Tax=unclassified Nesterenkonia TaxID=2629769 RepID=UPI001A92D66B|nr:MULTISPECIES: sulfite exporter TauE/SafE family protein [unclassified Nesterenkonia]MBO0594824.1 sulfite exporter TauE/SafE family protein [Nesterenkonia sp. E16_10]MBO0597073.1 sulfite exporter TauE/SafE family protein [Nesterenkonia sp. E16_7]
MVELDALSWVLLGAGALVVGLSKTALPGGGTLAVVLFAMALPARESTAALLVLLIVGDLFAISMYRRTVDWVLLRRLIWPVLLGVAVGTVFLGLASDAAVRRVIGAILLGLLVFTLLRRRRDQRRQGGRLGRQGQREQVRSHSAGSRAAGFGYGWLGGFTTMVANAGGPVMSMYLLAKRLDVKTFLGTAAFFFFAVNLVKVPFQIGLGLLNTEILGVVLVLVPLVVVAAFLGRWIAGRISQTVFERLVLGLTALGAVNLLL